MQIVFHRDFLKRYKKFPQQEKQQIEKKLHMFMKNPFHESLNNHRLKGVLGRYRSINISGDVRAIYEQIDEDTAFFITLGTHSELYK